MSDQPEKKEALNKDGFVGGAMLTHSEQVKLRKIKRDKQRKLELEALKKAK